MTLAKPTQSRSPNATGCLVFLLYPLEDYATLHLIAAFLFVARSLGSPAQQPQPIPKEPSVSADIPPRNPQWDRVNSLAADEPIAVLEQGRRFPLPCRIDWVDEASLACIVYAPHSAPQRIVYPVADIAAVYSEEPADGPGTNTLLLGAGIGGGIGAIVCHGAKARTIFACAGIGGLIGLGVAVTPHPTPYPPRPRTRLRLIYSSP